MARELELHDRVRLARLGGKVERCHILPHRPGYTNAAHSWGVAMLMLQLWPAEFPRLAAACIVHDVPEAWVGDVPAHTKARSPELRRVLQDMENGVLDRLQLPREADLSPEDLRRLKACDQLELWLWAEEEDRLGNHHAYEVLRKLASWFERPEGLPTEARALYERLRNLPPPEKALAMEDY